MHTSFPRVCVIRLSLLFLLSLYGFGRGTPPFSSFSRTSAFHVSSHPLGERTRQSGWTTSHFDSHTMGDHEDEITEMSSPPHEVVEEDPTSTYGPSHEKHS